MLPWNPPASLGMQHQQQQQQQHEMQQGQGQQMQGQQQQQQQQNNQLPAQASQISLAQVLHYLQTEWRRYERERNEWEIERGEMRARIALLEGERRGTENLKTDLMRRVKMLEYALRQERNKYLTSATAQAAAEKVAAAAKKDAAAAASAAPSKKTEGEKPSAIAPDVKKVLDEESGQKAGSRSSSPAPPSKGAPAASEDGQGSTVPDVVVSGANAQAPAPASAIPPHLQDSGASRSLTRPSSTASLVSLPNGMTMNWDKVAGSVNLPAGTMSSLGGAGQTGTMGGLGWNPSLGRDPRGRAKSRDYLKQCLQEISYLTSATALNPLPDRMAAGVQRPRKAMVEVSPPSSQNNSDQRPSTSQSQPTGNQVAQPGQSGPPGQSKVTQANSALPETTDSVSAKANVDGMDSTLGASTANAVAAGVQQGAGAGTQVNGNTIVPLDLSAESQGAGTGMGGNNVTSTGSEGGLGTSQSAAAPSPLSREVPLSPQPPNTDEIQPAPAGSQQHLSLSRATADSALSSLSQPELLQDDASSTSSAGSDAGSYTSGDNSDAASRLTAIFRPESSEEWKKALKKAGQEAGVGAGGPAGSTSVSTNGIDGGEEAALRDLGRERSGTIKEKDQALQEVTSEHKTWRTRRTLRSHLDSTRCVAFDRADRPTDVSLATGSDDCTVKFWRMSPQSVSASARSGHLPDSEPAITYRGHTASVTALALSSATNRIYSCSLDSTIQVWQIPAKDREPYAAYDRGLNEARLEGHTDAIWDVCLLSAPMGERELLASASADGTVKIWDCTPSASSSDGEGAQGSNRRAVQGLIMSWTSVGVDSTTDAIDDSEKKGEPLPTSLALIQSDLTKLAVGYQDGIVRIFDIATGQLVSSLKPKEPADGDEHGQINRLVSHPTLPMIVTASSDNYIRFFDLKTFSLTYSLLAHSNHITSLDVDPSGLTLCSGSDDGDIRFWDLLSPTKNCLQEIGNAHRIKNGEGTLEVRYHPTLPFVASGGADGGVRIYG